jgi:hypothetical protein
LGERLLSLLEKWIVVSAPKLAGKKDTGFVPKRGGASKFAIWQNYMANFNRKEKNLVIKTA